MDALHAAMTLAILAQEARVDIFRMLAREELTATRLASVLRLSRSTVVAHLATLEIAELVTRRRAGASTYYSANLSHIHSVLDILIADCCGGRPELCEPTLSDLRRHFELGNLMSPMG